MSPLKDVQKHQRGWLMKLQLLPHALQSGAVKNLIVHCRLMLAFVSSLWQVNSPFADILMPQAKNDKGHCECKCCDWQWAWDC